MLHRYPTDVPYLRFEELKELSDRPPEDVEAAVDRLRRLLPLLGDELVPVWTSPPLPFQPVALASFLDKTDVPLVAAACESGLVAVTSAEKGDGWTSLQIPAVQPRGGRIHGLWASRAVRPFGPWTELHVLVVPREHKPEDHQLYRALVRSREGAVELLPASETIYWEHEGLPEHFGWLAQGRVFCNGGADPFEVMTSLYWPLELRALTSRPGNLVAYGQGHVAWVEQGDRLRSRWIPNEVISKDLPDEVHAAVCFSFRKEDLKDKDERIRVVLASGRKQLEALDLVQGKGEWARAWRQLLRGRALAIDCATGNGKWRNLYVADNLREVVRYAQVGPDWLKELWESEVRRLALTESIGSPKEWIRWCTQRFDETPEIDTAEGRSLHRLLHYLALDRLLASPEDVERSELRDALGELYSRERHAAVLLPAIRRLEAGLSEWELDPGGTGLPELVWACYDQKPFRIQEVLDVHFREVPEENHSNLRVAGGDKYAQLLEDSRNVAAFFDPVDKPLRRAGVHLSRALEPFVTAAFSASGEAFAGCRHLVALNLSGKSLVVAFGSSWIDFYELEEVEHPGGNPAREVFLRRVPTSPEGRSRFRAPEFVHTIVGPEEREYVVFGTRHGVLAALNPETAVRNLGDALSLNVELQNNEDGEPEGQLVAAVPFPRRDALLVAENRYQKPARLLEVVVGPEGKPAVCRSWETPLQQISTLDVFTRDGKWQVVAGEYGDVVLLELDEAGREVVHERGRRHLGSTVLDLSLICDEQTACPLLACITRNGHLFATHLDSSLAPWQRIRWIHHVTHGNVRRVEGLRGSGRVGVVGAQGHVALYEKDGTRSFLSYPNDPTEASTFVPAQLAGDPEYLVLAHESGMLTVLRSTGDSKKCLERAREALLKPETTSSGSNNESWQLGRTLQRFDNKEDPAAIYSSLSFQAAQKALVCLVSRSGELAPKRQEALARALGVEDLTFLLKELRNGDVRSGKSLEQVAWHKLAFLTQTGPDSRRAPGLLCEVLRFSRRSGVPGQVDRLRKLPGRLFENGWVAHLVAEQLFKELDEPQEETSKILVRLLSELARFPMSVCQAAATLLSGSQDSLPLEGTLRALVRLGEALRAQAQDEEVHTGLRDLAKALSNWREEKSAIGLFARYVDCVDPSDVAKDETRGALLSILADANIYGEADTLLGLIFQRMALWCPREPPDDEDTLLAWRNWLQETGQRLRSLEQQRDELGTESKDLLKAHKVWQGLCDALLRQGRQALAQWVEAKEKSLRSEVRLHLRPRSNRRPSRLTAELEVLLTPEALRRTTALEYDVDFGARGGLGAAGSPLRFQGRVDTVDPQRSESETVNVRGTVAPDQEKIQVSVHLRWDKGGEHWAMITLPLRPPPDARSLAAEAPFPDTLPLWSQALVERVMGLPAQTVVVLIDDELGRAGLVRQFEGPGTRTIDLDQALGEVGPGRAFPAYLNLESFRTALKGGRVPFDTGDSASLKGGGLTIHVANCDEVWNRLLADPQLHRETNGIINFLSGNASGDPRIFFFLGHEVGQQLRRRATGLKFVEAYRLPDENEHEGIWQEAASWLTSVWVSKSTKVGRAVLRELGGDLRFALLLRKASTDPSFDAGSGGVKRILESDAAQRIFQSDLAGLPPLSIQLLMTASCSIAILRFNQVRQAMVVAEEFSSTPRGAGTPKVILRRGDRVGSRAARALDGDLRQQERQLRVEGFSVDGTAETNPSMRSFTTFFDSRQGIRNAAEPLVTIGAAEKVEGLVRAGQPYGRLIRELTDKGKSPTEVYSFLTGGASALEGLSFEELVQLSPSMLLKIQPRLSVSQAEAIHDLTVAWQALRGEREPSQQNLLRIFRELTGHPTERLAQGPEDSTEEWGGLLEGPRDILLGLGERTPEGGFPYYLAILLGSAESGKLSEPSRGLLRAVMQRGGEGNPKGRLIVLRPGRASQRLPNRWVELTDDDLKEAALHPKFASAFWAKVRAGAGLTALAPFRAEGALPPGSRIFFGRQQEIDTMLQSVREQSFLIVGSRQIGKTSLLNQILHQLQKRSDIEVYHFDLQEGSDSMQQGLRELCGRRPGMERAGTLELLKSLIERNRTAGKTSIVLLNEIDDLIDSKPDLIRAFRGLHDSARARFVMTGYFQAAGSCYSPKSPFYHWTSSKEGRPYMVLAELSDRAAQGIVDLLEAPPLELVWESEEEKQLGVRYLLERSYRIPHLLQAICLGLVHRLEEKRRSVLRASDVEEVARQPSYSPWSHVTKINFGDLVPGIKANDREKAGLLVELLLLTAIKRIYFRGAPPPIQTNIRARDPRSLSFDIGNLREWFPDVLSSLLRDDELTEAKKFFERIDLQALLLGLSLTLILSFEPIKGRYYFQSHLYPIEIQRQFEAGELIDDRIVRKMLRLYSFVT